MSGRYHNHKMSEKMRKKHPNGVAKFCKDNHISHNKTFTTFYFTVGNQYYRVSNHSVEESNKDAYGKYGQQVRPLYHPGGERADTKYVRGSSWRLAEIYSSIVALNEIHE